MRGKATASADLAHSGKRTLTAFPAIAMMAAICLGMLSCGGSNGVSGTGGAGAKSAAKGSSSQPGNGPYAGDIDQKEDVRHDADDDQVLKFGEPAQREEARRIAALVKRYFAAAAIHDGATACSLLYSSQAESIVEDYGEDAGPADTRGKTCGAVMTKIFEKYRRQLRRTPSILRVAQVRIKGNRAMALLDLGRSRPLRHILVHRERGVWRVGWLLAAGMT